jgi:hypothetical protein
MYELGIWHPLALPADKQNRAGYESCRGAPWIYPSWASRRQRQQAIDAVRAFREEAKDLIAGMPEAGSDFQGVGGALHIQLYLSPAIGSRIAAAIAETAQRHGLAFYDPQSNLLTLPAPGSSAVENVELPTPPDEPGIAIAFGPWTIRAYVERTRRCYTKIMEGGSDRCACDNCRNLAQVRDRAYPPEVLTVFESLGVDSRKESEVHYYGRTPEGLHTYRGWLYLVGWIERGPDSWYRPENGKPEKRFHRIGSHFEVGLSKKGDFGFSDWETVLISAGFADHPRVEIDFYADLPWLLDAPEPEQIS